jgi:hypothetical protein
MKAVLGDQPSQQLISGVAKTDMGNLFMDIFTTLETLRGDHTTKTIGGSNKSR